MKIGEYVHIVLMNNQFHKKISTLHLWFCPSGFLKRVQLNLGHPLMSICILQIKEIEKFLSLALHTNRLRAHLALFVHRLFVVSFQNALKFLRNAPAQSLANKIPAGVFLLEDIIHNLKLIKDFLNILVRNLLTCR